jgi:2-keto-3-deoxy-L-rhamnonate aldolase RhmA
MRRDVGYVREVGGESFVSALDDAVVALMIEKRQAVEDIEAILAMPGVDMVQFGPADYAMSIGLAGKWDHPEVVTVVGVGPRSTWWPMKPAALHGELR